MNSEKVENALNWVRIVLIAVLLAVIVLMEMIEMRYRVVYFIEPGEAMPTRVDTVYYYNIKNK